jgi:hypothetical protein
MLRNSMKVPNSALVQTVALRAPAAHRNVGRAETGEATDSAH